MAIYKTVYQVEVFSDGPFTPDGGDDDPFDLAEINYAIIDGDCIGAVDRLSSESGTMVNSSFMEKRTKKVSWILF